MRTFLKSPNRFRYIRVAFRTAVSPDRIYWLNHGYVRAKSKRDNKVLEILDDMGMTYLERDINLHNLESRDN